MPDEILQHGVLTEDNTIRLEQRPMLRVHVLEMFVELLEQVPSGRFRNGANMR